jgi:acetyl-CoA/propionyl-CoA carboxylase biotin carboxyl carrier protein
LSAAGGVGAAPAPAEPVVAVDPATVAAPIAGTVQAWKAADGERVAEGDVIATMEAMKMEMQVTAHRAGRLSHSAAQGAYVAAGTAIGRIEADGQ